MDFTSVSQYWGGCVYFFLPSVKKLRRLGSSLPSPLVVAGSVCARVGDVASAPDAALILLIQPFISSCNNQKILEIHAIL